ncbi:DUF6049 family protein [Kitasatospora sp. MAP5-34]|uniref:DUF6049 family protein n=1 Tax=Kitasatospora sp. MAP5-34 TaxID=3035102 RepID=UPI002475C8BB|nr:DUF6049 family protein [Kitasatospora sp. MAP5-34]MDH6576379.1 hypothetical protein [Kitasatospora sp. MAP5-34]
MGERSGRTTGRVAKRLAALLASSAVLLSAAAPALAAVPARSVLTSALTGALTSGSADYPAAMVIDTVKPIVASQSGDAVTITGQVTNTSGSELKSTHVAVRNPYENKPVQTRSDLGLIASRNTPAGLDGTDQNPGSNQQLGNLGAGQSRPFSVTVTPGQLGFDGTGVYELAVDIWGGTDDNEKPRPLGIARTFLPYNPQPASQPTRIATLWPLTHTPELVAQTMPDNEQTPVLRDESLATDLAPNGRLFQLVKTGEGLPGLTWVVDPDLLDAVYAMTKPYRVQKPGTTGESAQNDNTVAGTGKAAADAWLKELRTAVATGGNEVVALPYADPDFASIAHNGAGLAGTDTALHKAGTAGRLTAEGRLSVDVRSGVAWPYQGYLDQQIAATTRAAGDDLVLVNGASLPEDAKKLSYTPNAVRQLGGGQNALVSDQTISELFQQNLSSQQAKTAATQRFLAETLVITQEQPADQRNLLIMPPRTLTVDAANTLAAAIKEAQKDGWLSLAKLDTVAAATPTPGANTSVPGPTDYPDGLRGSELSASALADVMNVQSGLDQLMRILTQPQRVRSPFSAAMLRSMSTQWRDKPDAGSAYRTGVQDYLNNLVSAVKVPAKSVITLPGDSGTLLVSVKNDLNQAVGNLELRLTSGQLNRLNVGPPESIVLDATTSRTLRFPAKAQVNGSVQLTAQLYTTGPDAQPYGAPVTFTVEVTSVTQGVLYVIGCGVVLILLAAVRFYLQRKKRSTDPVDEPAADAADEPGSDPDATAGAEHASGPDSDPGSAADAGDPVSGDEKVGH